MVEFPLMTKKELFFGNSTEIKKTTPILISRFKAIRSKPRVDFCCFQENPIFGLQDSYRDLLQEAEKGWNYTYDHRAARDYLLEPSEASHKALKVVRSFGLILKAHYKLFDETHLCPENLHIFLGTLGEHADHYRVPQRQIFVDKLLEEDLLESLVNPGGFKPATSESFQDYTSQKINDIGSLSSEEILSAGDFHTLRKRLRLLMNLFQIPAVKNPEGQEQWLFYQLFNLCQQMGAEHDSVVKESIENGLDYEKASIVVDKSKKEEISRILPLVEKTIQ